MGYDISADIRNDSGPSFETEKGEKAFTSIFVAIPFFAFVQLIFWLFPKPNFLWQPVDDWCVEIGDYKYGSYVNIFDICSSHWLSFSSYEDGWVNILLIWAFSSFASYHLILNPIYKFKKKYQKYKLKLTYYKTRSKRASFSVRSAQRGLENGDLHNYLLLQKDENEIWNNSSLQAKEFYKQIVFSLTNQVPIYYSDVTYDYFKNCVILKNINYIAKTKKKLPETFDFNFFSWYRNALHYLKPNLEEYLSNSYYATRCAISDLNENSKSRDKLHLFVSENWNRFYFSGKINPPVSFINTTYFTHIYFPDEFASYQLITNALDYFSSNEYNVLELINNSSKKNKKISGGYLNEFTHWEPHRKYPFK